MASKRLLPAGILAGCVILLSAVFLRGGVLRQQTSQTAIFYGCGNGVMELGEQCEQGVAQCPSEHSCQSCQCVMTALCGNNVLDLGEQCEPDLVQCPGMQTCDHCECRTPYEVCGDGRMVGSEQCENTILSACTNPGSICIDCVCRREVPPQPLALVIMQADGPAHPTLGNVMVHTFRVKNMTSETATQVRLTLSHNGTYPLLDTSLTTPGCAIDGPNVILCQLMSLGPYEISDEITIAFEVGGCMNTFLRAASAIARTVLRNQINSQIIRFPQARICSYTVSSSSQSQWSYSSRGTGLCGNHVLDAGESCEVNVCCPWGDTCSLSDCTCVPVSSSSESSAPDPVCGNGFIEGNEQCEQQSDCGSIVCVQAPCPTYRCSNCLCTPTFSAVPQSTNLLAQVQPQRQCGNGIVESGETCEVNMCCSQGILCNDACECVDPFGPLSSSSSSFSTYPLISEACRNNVLDSSEECEADYNCSTDSICDDLFCRCETSGNSRGMEPVIVDSRPVLTVKYNLPNWFQFYPPAQPTDLSDANAFGGNYYRFPHETGGYFAWTFPLNVRGTYEFYISEVMSGQPLRCTYQNSNGADPFQQCTEDPTATFTYKGVRWRKIKTFTLGYDYTPSFFRVALSPTGTASTTYKIDAVLMKKQDPPPDPSSLCGNGRLDGEEACDDANSNLYDGCYACMVHYGWTCTGEPSVCTPVCGDTYMEGGEQCDEGRNPPLSGDGCSASCRIERGWTCMRVRDARTMDVSQCSTVCGDGIVISEREPCDDGNPASADGCVSCTVESGWTCSGEPSVCRTTCGDGIKVGPEACDDSNVRNGDGCTSLCTQEAGWTCAGTTPTVCQKCGNGKREGTEQCDDGNSVDYDCCTSRCRVESGCSCTIATPNVCGGVCGNGTIEWNEACDDGNTLAGDGCSNCTTIDPGWQCNGVPTVCSKCGNGVMELSETCDDSNTLNDDGCSSLCTLEQGYACSGKPSVCYRCGNGRIESGERCDDGNKTNNDGCSIQCLVEAGWTCSGTPSVCAGICGNGIIQKNEQCDDGNAKNGDGCTACAIDASWTCIGAPSACHKCGNGIVEFSEACDDRNITGGDGCSSTCGIELGWSCVGS
ncbi:MAG: DUF4215 domain-containing protein, partial [Candidatus Peribacteraceae bacterium]|nr:DUF4215 domain-containing protein [Candidatus Peribacteraceae bacterium]